MDKKYLVTKANVLINSRYDLSVNEQRLILILASLVQPEDEDFKNYELSVAEFTKLLGFEGESSYTTLRKLTHDLMTKTFEIKNEKSILQINWLSSCEYILGSGKVQLEFSPKLKPYLLQLKGNFTSYTLGNVLRMESKYAIRLYEILRSNLYKGCCTFTLDELRYMLKAEHYSAGNFKQRVLGDHNEKDSEKSNTRAITEINKYTDIDVTYNPIKEGKKIVAIRFTIKSKAAQEAQLYRTYDDNDLKYYDRK